MVHGLADAACRVQQAQAVLSIWLENTNTSSEANLVASLITILEGVDEAIDKADEDSVNKI